jgi:hypothetical protein
LRPQKKSVAENVLRSWLRATGVPFQDQDGVLLVEPSTRIAVVLPGNKLADDVLSIVADISAADLTTALEVFHVVTYATGHGLPTPVDRGPAPGRAEIYGQDLFLVAARHREFRNSPDLNRAQAAFYRPVVVRWARGFHRRNRQLCLVHGYEVDDLVTFGWMWAHVFAHKSEVVTNGDDNLRLLTRYLQQRGGELHRYLVKKVRDTTPDAPTAHFALTGEPLVTSSSSEEGEPGRRIIVRSRKDAGQQLRSNLAALPHDRMVLALTDASTNPNRDYATQQMAAKLLREHASGCSSCNPVSQGREENVRGADAARGAEAL